jgi:hypothetical protein
VQQANHREQDFYRYSMPFAFSLAICGRFVYAGKFVNEVFGFTSNLHGRGGYAWVTWTFQGN